MFSQRQIARVGMALVVVVLGVALSGCAGSTPGADDSQPSTSLKYLINPLNPGQGYLQLGQNRYPFRGVICATGPVKSDPAGSTRIFGVYANFEVGGKLAAISLTRYRSEIIGKTHSVPTITETALVQMQGKGEVLGLKAQRAQVIGQPKWHDIFDVTQTTALITRVGDRYDAKGTFGPVDGGVVGEPTATTTAGSSSANTMGEIAARCPAKRSTSSTSTTPSTSS